MLISADTFICLFKIFFYYVRLHNSERGRSAELAAQLTVKPCFLLLQKGEMSDWLH